jgi:hypothetical protein
MGGRVVCYSYSPPRDRGYRSLLLSQLVASARTLRSHNAAIPVRVFWLGASPVDPGTARELRELDVQVLRGPGYEQLLATVPGAELLAGYPVLQKYFAPEALLAQEPWSQVLLLDCDSLFLGDVERLFDRYPEAGVVGVPDVGTSRRGGGYDPAYLDEDRVRALAESLAGRYVAPVNGGVLLLGEQALQQHGRLRRRIVELTLRLLVGIAGRASGPAELPAGTLREIRRRLDAGDPVAAPLPFPSSNAWIAEEVALWLGLGLADALAVRDFDPADVALGDEVYAVPRESSSWILGHYFSSNTARARAWWDGRAPATSPPGRPRTSAPRPRTLEVDEFLLSSPLVTEHRGFTTYDRLVPADALAEMTEEAREAYWQAREQRQQRRVGDEGRRSHPPRRLVSGGGGAAQDEVYQSGWLRDVLADLCRLPVEATGSRGSVNYYTRAGDFMGLHLDVVECELVVLTVLADRSDPDDQWGAYELFPGHVGAPLSSVRAGAPDRVVTKLGPGQSLVLFGGLVPHLVRPVRDGQHRIVSALCFRVDDPASARA